MGHHRVFDSVRSSSATCWKIRWHLTDPGRTLNQKLMTSPDVDNPESHKALQLGRSDWMRTPAAWTGSMKSDVGYCMFQTKLHCHVCSTGGVLTKTARHLWTQGTYWKCFWQDWIDQQTVSLTLLSKRQTTRQRARQRQPRPGAEQQRAIHNYHLGQTACQSGRLLFCHRSDAQQRAVLTAVDLQIIVPNRADTPAV